MRKLTRITHQLQELLKQAGWYDDVNAMALEELSGQREPNLDQTSAKIQQKAMAMVPDQIKLEILQKIREFVNSNVESAP